MHACCPGAISAGMRTSDQPAHSWTWQFEMCLKSSDRSGAVVALHWARTVHDPAAVDADSIERSYEVSLSEHQKITLDLVRPRVLTNQCEGVSLELELRFQDPPELENALLDYDIWLLQTDESGREFIDRVQPRGFQGRDTEYAFRRQHYDMNGTRSATGPVSIALSGQVKGRVRSDGRIDLVVSLGRTVWVGSLGTGDGGLKQETVADGETIELATPRMIEGPARRSGRQQPVPRSHGNPRDRASNQLRTILEFSISRVLDF